MRLRSRSDGQGNWKGPHLQNHRQSAGCQGRARTIAADSSAKPRAAATVARPDHAADATLGSVGSPGAGARSPSPRLGAAPPPGSLQMSGGAQLVVSGLVASEGEIAVSTNGQNVVISQQGRFTTSNDGGQRFNFAGFFPTLTPVIRRSRSAAAGRFMPPRSISRSTPPERSPADSWRFRRRSTTARGSTPGQAVHVPTRCMSRKLPRSGAHRCGSVQRRDCGRRRPGVCRVAPAEWHLRHRLLQRRWAELDGTPIPISHWRPTSHHGRSRWVRLRRLSEWRRYRDHSVQLVFRRPDAATGLAAGCDHGGAELGRRYTVRSARTRSLQRRQQPFQLHRRGR